MQVIVIVAVFLAVAAQEGLADMNPEQLPQWFMAISGYRSALFIMGTLVLFWALLRSVISFLLLKLSHEGEIQWSYMRIPNRLDTISGFTMIAIYGLQLTYGGWCLTVQNDWGIRGWILLDEVILLAPFLALMTVKLVCFYPVNRFVKEYVVAGQLQEGLSARPVWTLKRYLIFQIRHGVLIILVPILLILLLRDLADTIIGYLGNQEWPDNNWRILSEVFVMAGGALVFLFSPFLLRFIWSTRVFPYGPLREKLEALMGRIGVGCREILLWDTYSSLANAGVMGIIPQVRYVLLSDAVVENMSDSQIEAVCSHEAGHVHYHHIPLLVMFVIGCGTLGSLLMDTFSGWLDSYLAGVELGDLTVLGLFGLTLLTGLGLGLILFGMVSRRFERQADVFAARMLREDDESPLNTLHPVGASIMSMALQKVALLNGVAINARSWRHSSIASRMAFLQDLAMKPGALKRFDQQMRILKSVIIIMFIAAVCWTVWQIINEANIV